MYKLHYDNFFNKRTWWWWWWLTLHTSIKHVRATASHDAAAQLCTFQPICPKVLRRDPTNRFLSIPKVLSVNNHISVTSKGWSRFRSKTSHIARQMIATPIYHSEGFWKSKSFVFAVTSSCGCNWSMRRWTGL